MSGYKLTGILRDKTMDDKFMFIPNEIALPVIKING